MSAYESYLRALQLAGQYDTVIQAEPYLQKAVELDPEFAGARAMLSFVESIKFWWSYDPSHLDSGLRIAKAALQLDPEEAYGHLASGFALMFMRRFREAETSLDRAVALNPNDPFILSIRALLLNYVGKYDAALVELEQAQRRDPFAVGWFEDFLGIILTNAGRYREALASYAKMATVPHVVARLSHHLPCRVGRNETSRSRPRKTQVILSSISRHYARRHSERGSYPRRPCHLRSLPRDPAAH